MNEYHITHDTMQAIRDRADMWADQGNTTDDPELAARCGDYESEIRAIIAAIESDNPTDVNHYQPKGQ
jgi:hypothetical protein